MKNWLVMLTLLKGRVMPNYVAGKDLATNTERMFNISETHHMSKRRVVEKVIDKLHGQYRRRKLEKAFKKLSVEELVTVGLLVDQAIKKEVEKTLNSNCKDVI